MLKKYSIKVYTLAGSYVTTISPNIIQSEVSFSWAKNSGQGEMELVLAENYDTIKSWLIPMSVLKIYEIDGANKLGRLIYTGFVSRYIPYLQGGVQGTKASLLGLGSLLALSLYYDGAFSFSKSGDPKTIIEGIITKFNTVYAGNWIKTTAGNLDTVGTSVNLTFDKKSWRDSIEMCRKVSGANYYWRVDADGEFYFKLKPSTPTHKFTIGSNVEAYSVTTDSEKVENDISVKWSGGTVSGTDATSISTFGTRKKYYDESTSLNDVTSANQRLAQILADKKDQKKKAGLTINSLYDLETLKVGQTCRVYGADVGTGIFDTNMQIASANYTPDLCRLELEERTSFADEVNDL